MRPPFTGVSTLSGNVDVAPNGVFLFVGLLVRSRASTTHTVSHERAAPLIGDATSPWWRRMLENGGGGGRSNVVVLHPSVRHWLLRSITHRSIRGRWLHLFCQTLPGASVPSGYHQRRVSMPAIRVIAPLPSIATTALRTDDRFERPAAARENYARRISRGNSSRSHSVDAAKLLHQRAFSPGNFYFSSGLGVGYWTVWVWIWLSLDFKKWIGGLFAETRIEEAVASKRIHFSVTLSDRYRLGID